VEPIKTHVRGPRREQWARRTTEFVADLVEPAKTAALDKLDEGQRALSIATGWLRAKMASRPVAVSGSVAEKER